MKTGATARATVLTKDVKSPEGEPGRRRVLLSHTYHASKHRNLDMGGRQKTITNRDESGSGNSLEWGWFNIPGCAERTHCAGERLGRVESPNGNPVYGEYSNSGNGDNLYSSLNHTGGRSVLRLSNSRVIFNNKNSFNNNSISNSSGNRNNIDNSYRETTPEVNQFKHKRDLSIICENTGFVAHDLRDRLDGSRYGDREVSSWRGARFIHSSLLGLTMLVLVLMMPATTSALTGSNVCIKQET